MKIITLIIGIFFSPISSEKQEFPLVLGLSGQKFPGCMITDTHDDTCQIDCANGFWAACSTWDNGKRFTCDYVDPSGKSHSVSGKGNPCKW